jgi:glycosyltransferase involved in cell wall biosynthesis
LTPQSLLLVTPLWGRDGGVAAHVRASAALLAGHGLDVRVLAAHVHEDAGEPGVIAYHSSRLFDPRASREERLAGAKSFRADVVHLHQIDDPGVTDAVRAIAPLAISAHAYSACTSGVHYFRPGHECDRAHGPMCAANIVLRGCAHTRHIRHLPSSYRAAGERLRALRSADLAIAYSSAVERHLAANGVERRRLVPLFPTTAPTSAPTSGGDPCLRRVVFAGRMVAPKGVGVLIRAAREVDAEFVLCGTGRMLEPMRRLARRLGVAHRVAFRGWLDATAVAHELAGASVVAVPSLWPEPFGLVGIEALAAGRPVVASATGGILDWLRDGVNGLAVQPGNVAELARALSTLLEDPRRCEQMGKRGRELVASHFSPRRHVESLLDAYGAVCAPRAVRLEPAPGSA